MQIPAPLHISNQLSWTFVSVLFVQSVFTRNLISKKQIHNQHKEFN